MPFYRNFLPLPQLTLLEQSINKHIGYFKYRAHEIPEENSYESNWETYLSRQYLENLFNDPNPYHKESRKISIKEDGLEHPIYPVFPFTKILKNIFPDYKLKQSGCFLYPKGGYMGWHTNHDSTEDRLYITYAAEDKKSFFRYYENGEIITDYDDKGITIRRFSIPEKPPYFWHCVGSETDRYSFGYRLHPKKQTS